MDRKFKTLGALALLGAALIVPALAGNTILFSSKTGDIIFPITPPNSSKTGGSIGDATRGGMAPVNGADAYFKVVAGTGFSYTFGNYQSEMIFRPAGTLAAGYVTMAPAPVDGARQCVFSTQEITAFYANANTGQSINNAVTALAANTRYCYTYSQSNLTWDRSN